MLDQLRLDPLNPSRLGLASRHKPIILYRKFDYPMAEIVPHKFAKIK